MTLIGTLRVTALIAAGWAGCAAGVVRAAELQGTALYAFAPVPDWVKRAEVDYDAPLPSGGVSDGVWDLLLDSQTRIEAAGDDYYHHSARKIVTPRGIDDQSQIDIRLDPTRQSLLLHSLRVIRDGRVMDQRPTSRITALPQETELRKRIYDGSYNINILLSDVRVGDVVEFDYTIRSRERVFPGIFSDRTSIAWSIPVKWQRFRYLVPANRPLSYRAPDGASPPVEVVRAGMRDIEWQWRDVAAIVADDERPSWHSPWPRLELSDSPSWSAVARRIVPLYQVTEPPSPAFTAAVEEIRRSGGSPAQLALRALQFVQSEIRYVSISIGPAAFRPASPNTVLGRRFGDCKDKSLLLAMMLRALGIEAQPALVNTRRGHVLDAALPTPYIFDHAIVRMRIGDEIYWLDGTDEEQYSPLSADAPADFERALVIDPDTIGLSRIPRPAPDVSRKKSAVLIDLRAGVDKPGKLQITTSYAGWLADSERRTLAGDSPAERQTSYVNYIAQYYPGARPSAPIAIRDDKANNVVEVSETYDLDQTFTPSDGRLQFFLQADEIYRYVGTLKSSVRTAPLAIDYPVEVQQTVRVLLPERWSIDDETVVIDNPAFKYKSIVSLAPDGKAITVDYRYESLADYVDLAALPRYVADRRRVFDDLGYFIRPATKTPAPEPAQTLAAPPAVAAALSLLVGLWIGIRVVSRWDPEPARAEPTWPAGLRGWLSLPALHTLLSPLGWAAWLLERARVLDVAHWPRLHDTVPEPLTGWAPTVLLGLTVVSVLIFVGQAVLIPLFLRKRSSVPALFIAIHWCSSVVPVAALLFLIGAHLAAPLEGKQLVLTLLAPLLSPAVYTAYMLRSKRVKATFVVRLRDSARSVTVPASAG